MNTIIFESPDNKWFGTYDGDGLDDKGLDITIGNCLDVRNCTYQGTDQSVDLFSNSTTHWTLYTKWIEDNILHFGPGRMDYFPSERRWWVSYNTFDVRPERAGVYYLEATGVFARSSIEYAVPELSALTMLLIGAIILKGINKWLKSAQY